MAPKIQPLPAAAASPPCCSLSGGCGCGGGGEAAKRPAVYTVWMKSLVFNGNGCTVYGPDGRVAFRVDNYGCRGGREAFFMDRAGNTLVAIRRRSFGVFRRRWEARRCFVDGGEEETAAAAPWFRVRRSPKGGAAVTVQGGGGGEGVRRYRIEGCSRKSEWRISACGGDGDGAAVAEVARKQTASGVVLGEDVLTLTVGPGVDHLLVLGLVVVCGLMNRSL